MACLRSRRCPDSDQVRPNGCLSTTRKGKLPFPPFFLFFFPENILALRPRA